MEFVIFCGILIGITELKALFSVMPAFDFQEVARQRSTGSMAEGSLLIHDALHLPATRYDRGDQNADGDDADQDGADGVDLRCHAQAAPGDLELPLNW